MGRFSTYTESVGDLIIARLAEGESLRSICEANPDLPDRSTILRWQHDNEDFAAKCARAREFGAESHYDDMAQIETDVLSGALEPKAANVVLANKRWRLEKLKPRVFGARVAHEVTGANGGPLEVATIDVANMSDSALAEFMRARRAATDAG